LAKTLADGRARSTGTARSVDIDVGRINTADALAAILGVFMRATLYGVRRFVIEYPAPSTTISCHEKLDHFRFSALCSGDDASFVREREREHIRCI
jgi:hypothetical protein